MAFPLALWRTTISSAWRDLEPATLIAAYRHRHLPDGADRLPGVLAGGRLSLAAIVPLDRFRVTRSMRQSAQAVQRSR